MHRFLLVAAAILPLAVAEPVFSQGVLLPGSANATPPPGTIAGTSTMSPPHRRTVRHHRRARHRRVVSQVQIEHGVRTL